MLHDCVVEHLGGERKHDGYVTEHHLYPAWRSYAPIWLTEASDRGRQRPGLHQSPVRTETGRAHPWCRQLGSAQTATQCPQKCRPRGQTSMLLGQQLVSPGAACQAGL